MFTLSPLKHTCSWHDKLIILGRYLFDNNDGRAKTLGDSKPNHYHVYMNTENKVKSHKATISNICVYYK